MRIIGTVSKWNDDRGFGFITPNGGGKRVFVHASAFRNRQRRPEGDELVTYELAVDEKGRGQAMQVAFVGEPARGDGKLVPAWLPTFFTVGFLAFLAATVMAGSQCGKRRPPRLSLFPFLLIDIPSSSCGLAADVGIAAS